MVYNLIAKTDPNLGLHSCMPWPLTNPLDSWCLSIIVVYWVLQYFGSLYFQFFKWKVLLGLSQKFCSRWWKHSWLNYCLGWIQSFDIFSVLSYKLLQRITRTSWTVKKICCLHCYKSHTIKQVNDHKNSVQALTGREVLDNNLMKNNLFSCVFFVWTFLVLNCVEFPFKIPVWACTKRINNSWKSWLGSCEDQQSYDLLGSPSTDDYRKLEPGLQDLIHLVWGLWQNNPDHLSGGFDACSSQDFHRVGD